MNLERYDAARHDGFVYGGWLAGFRDSPTWGKVSTDIYYPYQRALIHDLLRRSVCLVADDAGVLAGFVVMERHPGAIALHWASVKRVYRGDGLARLLVAAALAELDQSAEDRLVFTHLNPPYSRFFEAGGWEYRPGHLGRKERRK
jgi:ribosomal protein S18 acetylase RimI-like enzyme